MLRRTILTLFLVLLIASPISAHPGRTDASGGHTDSDTGDYHYHHGYSAHNHYDMDGDGNVDCPYDFDDQTGRNSGASSGSSSSYISSTSSSSTDYRRGYNAGHDDGYTEGKKYVSTTADRRYEEGLEEGRSSGYEDGYSVGFSRARTLAFCAAALISVILFLVMRHLNRSHREEIEQLKTDHAQQLRQHRDLITERDLAITTLQDQLSRCDMEYRQQLQILADTMHQTTAAELAELEAQNRLQEFVRQRAPLAQMRIDFPSGLRLNEDRLYWGEPTKEKPYGDATVFITPYTGQCWHCKKGCSNSYTPVFLFDAVRKLRPCTRCIPSPYRHMQVPEWYEKFESVVRGDYLPKQLTSPQR